MSVNYGQRVSNQMLTFVKADERIRPLRDQIVIEPLDWKPSALLQTVYRGHYLRGIVRATGPGCYPKRYDGPRGKRSKVWDAKCFRPCDVKVGDEVELGGLEIGGYLFQTMRWGDKEVIVCREEDVCVVREPSGSGHARPAAA